MKFSERMGIVPQKQIQTDDIDQTLRNRIMNRFTINELGEKYILDKLGLDTFGDAIVSTWQLRDYMNKCPWYEIYNIFEYYLMFLRSMSHAPFFKGVETEFINDINKILEEEKSGYRIIDDRVAPITNPLEIESIEDSMKLTATAYSSVKIHLSKALKLYSDRQNPDYENSIKESISAVEAMCSIIVGKDTTLRDALRQLENRGIDIHVALKQGFDRIYGYTSDEKGIRHAGIEFSDAPHEDAKYMLVACSAFVNYLIEKYEKSKEINHE